MSTGRIEAIGFEDKTSRPAFATDVKKKKPIDEIGAAMTGIGSLVGNFAANLNSVFEAPGRAGGDTQAAFRG